MTQVSPFTGRVFQRTLPARLLAAKPARPVPAGLQRIIRPEAASRWMLPSTSQFTPQYLETILRGALAGSPTQQWELFDLMEDTWPRLLKNANELKRAVVQREWRCESWAEEDQPAEPAADERRALVSNAVWKMRPDASADENGFQQTIYDIMDAWFKGTSVLELEWESRNDRQLGDIVAPRCTHWVSPYNYIWTNEGRLELTTPANVSLSYQRGQVSEPFPEDKFLIAICKAKTGHPLNSALLRPLAFWWCAANFTAEWFLNLAQIFGLPIRWANYDPNIPGLVDQVADMLENMGSAAWGAFPAGTTIELKDAGKAGQDNPQVALLERADRNCDILILGQTLTTDTPASGGGSRAQGDVHMSVRDEIIEACCDFAEQVINNQLVPMILRLNYGDTEYAPEFCAEPETIEDEKANAERDQILLQQGVAMPKAWFYKRHSIPLPAAGEDVIQSRASAGPLPPGGNAAAEVAQPPPEIAARLQAKDATDKIVDHALENLTGVQARWLGGVRPHFEELITLAQNQTITDAQFIAALEKANRQMPELFGRLKPSALAEALNNAMSSALVNGAARGAMQRKLPPS